MIQTVREQRVDYHSFVSTVISEVQKKLGEGYQVKLHKVTKNNSLVLDSLVAIQKDERFAPNIYIKPYYEAYLEGKAVEEIVNRLCDSFMNRYVSEFGENFTFAFEEIKQNIIYRLVNYEKNKELLTQIPHIRYLDLAITFSCLVREDSEGIGTIRITNEHLKQWKVSLEELKRYAARNTYQLLQPCIRSMEDTITSLIRDEFNHGNMDDLSEELVDQFLQSLSPMKKCQMYILTNQKGINGAACILYENLLYDFAVQKNSDFYILPSSIHEIILVPVTEHITKESLEHMVQEVNRTQVAEDEILSDRVYYFSRIKNAILM
jgi:hypothetical protein